MNNSLSTSASEPRQDSSSSEERFKLSFWLGRFEGYLFLNFKPATYERYSRILSRFYSYARLHDKERTFSFLRCDFEDYRDFRLKEGASPTTVAMELSVLRGFWRWMLRMEADGVLLNPVLGVRVKKPSNGKRRAVFDAGGIESLAA